MDMCANKASVGKESGLTDRASGMLGKLNELACGIRAGVAAVSERIYGPALKNAPPAGVDNTSPSSGLHGMVLGGIEEIAGILLDAKRDLESILDRL